MAIYTLPVTTIPAVTIRPLGVIGIAPVVATSLLRTPTTGILTVAGVAPTIT